VSPPATHRRGGIDRIAASAAVLVELAPVDVSPIRLTEMAGMEMALPLDKMRREENPHVMEHVWEDLSRNRGSVWGGAQHSNMP
jgi:hypothetical protein